MPRTCTICDSPQVAEIDAALAGGASYRAAAERFGTSASALVRHASHAGGVSKQAPAASASRGDNETFAPAINDLVLLNPGPSLYLVSGTHEDTRNGVTKVTHEVVLVGPTVPSSMLAARLVRTIDPADVLAVYSPISRSWSNGYPDTG